MTEDALRSGHLHITGVHPTQVFRTNILGRRVQQRKADSDKFLIRKIISISNDWGVNCKILGYHQKRFIYSTLFKNFRKNSEKHHHIYRWLIGNKHIRYNLTFY